MGKAWASIVQEQLSPQRKEGNTEENGKSHYLQTVQWQNHLQVILWLMCHVEVKHSVFCIVRKCQSCASTWGERRNAFMSDSELQTTPLSGWLTFLLLFLRRSHLLFPCLVHQSPHLFIVLPWLCLVASINVLSSLRTVSISYDVVPLRDPIFWILASTWKCWHCDLRGNWSSAKLCSKTTDFRWNWNSSAFGLTRSQSCI